MRVSIATRVAASVISVVVSGCTTVTGTPTVAGQVVGSVSVRQTAPVRDGGLQFDVVDVSKVKQVGDPKDPGLSVTARGVYVVVSVAVRNVDGAPLTFFDRYQKLVDSTGREFDVDMAADIYGNRSIRSTRISPGNELLVHICFDVPEGSVPRSLILRQSDSTAGVTVPIA
jgi:hypothetical protein